MYYIKLYIVLYLYIITSKKQTNEEIIIAKTNMETNQLFMYKIIIGDDCCSLLFSLTKDQVVVKGILQFYFGHFSTLYRFTDPTLCVHYSYSNSDNVFLLQIWDLDNMECVHDLDTSGGSVYSIAITPLYILCGTYENCIHVSLLLTRV